MLRGCKDYDQHLYMYVRFGEWASELLPKPDDDPIAIGWTDEKRIAHLLDGYHALLLDGWVQEPFEGDFSWVAGYRKAEAKGHLLASKLEAIKANDKATWDMIRSKLGVSHYSSIGDARAVIE